jgi:hypothetical protein
MLKSEEFRTKFVPGDRVRRSNSDRTGSVASDRLADKIMVRFSDGRTELWHVDETELVS